MQDATCSLKTTTVHHSWALQNVAESGLHGDDAVLAVPRSEQASLDQADRQTVDVALNTVASSLSRLALSTPDVSPPGLPSSLAAAAATSGHVGWPNESELFQAPGFLSSGSNGLPSMSLPSGSNGIGGNNGMRQSFSANPSQQQQRRAITGHIQPSANEAFGTNPSANSTAQYSSWSNNQMPAMNWLQTSSRTPAMPTRFGPVHHGRSMSVQNINLTGNASAPSRKFGNQYLSRGGGVFGAGPSASNFGVQGRTSYQPSADQYVGRYGGVDEKSILASLTQDAQPSGGLEAQWLDLIRSAVQEQVRGMSGMNTNSWSFNQHTDYSRQMNKGKLPFGLLESNGPMGGAASGADALSFEKQLALSSLTNASLAAAVSAAGLDRVEIYSRKVFVGGLPPDIDEDEIMLAFRRFGPLVVDWPHKAESKSYFPPKGYCFLLFQDELSVQALVEACTVDDSKLYWCVSSPTMKDKPVQVRPWNLSDADFVMDGSQPLDPRKTVFVGGVPRPLRAVELAMIMGRLYGGVCYAGIDTDPELKYPKGAGRVAFSSQQSYIAAISARFVQLQHGDIDKRVEVKPYVLDDQICDECAGAHSGGKFAPFFCANVTCLQYYCEPCWARIHSTPGREFHKPLVKEGADRPRAMPFRWC